MTTISLEDFLKVDIRLGTVVRTEKFPEARKPAYKLWIDFGNELGVRTASAQLTGLYKTEKLQGRQVVAVVNFPAKRVANFLSEVLVLGLADAKGDIVLIGPDRLTPNGSRVF